MAHQIKFLVVGLLAISSVSSERWSRQITDSSESPEVSNDWVPLAERCPTCHLNDRSGNGRVLNFQQNNQYQSPGVYSAGPVGPPIAAQPFQFSRFFLPQQQQHQNQQQQKVNYNQNNVIPSSQSFFKFEMPAYQDGTRQDNLPSVQTGYQIQHSFPPQSVLTSPLFSQNQVFPAEFHPQFGSQQQRLIGQKNIKPSLIEESKSNIQESSLQTKPTQQQQHLSAPSPTLFQPPTFQSLEPSSFQAQSPFQSNFNNYNQQPAGRPPQPTSETPQNEEVQLLYVPYDTLYNQKSEQQGFQNNGYNLIPQPVNPSHINNFYTPEPLTIPATTTTTYRPTTEFQDFSQHRFSTPKPKPKAHQPPLAMFVHRSGDNQPESSVNEVLTILKSANSIAVLDTPAHKRPPTVFVGPASMPAPEGYAKFELPYLSGINTVSKTLDDVPFFVAPLSYRAPKGFAKIPLPEPHVGSVVVNKPVEGYEPQRTTERTIRPYSSNQFASPATERTYQQQTSTRSTTQAPVSKHMFFIQDGRSVTPVTKEQFMKEQYHKEHTSERQRPHNRHQNQRRPEQQQQPFSFRPMPNTLFTEDFFARKPSPTVSISSSTESIKAMYRRPSPTAEGESQPIRSHSLGETPTTQPELIHPRRPSTSVQPTQQSSRTQEEQRMKTYYREQDAIRNRPSSTATTTAGVDYPTVHQYTPVSVDYDSRRPTIPTATPSPYYEGSTLRTTTQPNRITYYTPSVQTYQSPLQNVFNYVSSTAASYETSLDTTTERLADGTEHSENENEIRNNQDINFEAEYDPNPYKLPSELPPLTPNLPGLVNALTESDRLNAIERGTTESLTTTTSTTLRPSRRPIVRTRRPTAVTKTSSSVSYSSDSTTRRAIIRGRKPYVQKSSTTDSTSSRGSSTSTLRTPVIRNPNRIRYRPTPEERQQFRSKTKSGGKSQHEDNIEYQRDVLKQNYPVFNSANRGTDTEEASQTDILTENTPSQEPLPFPGLLEPMQIAQEYQQSSKDNYGPGYFPNEEEITEQPDASKNEIQPVYIGGRSSSSTAQTTTTTTTEPTENRETTRRPFIRRISRPTRTTTTTTESSVSIEPSSPDGARHTIRPKTRYDLSSQRDKVAKLRGRIRKPHPASTTQSNDENEQARYSQVKKVNKALYQDASLRAEKSQRGRTTSRFQLEAQESQWSPSLSNSENFQPIDEKAKYLNEPNFDNAPEIVTAGPELEETSKSDNYVVNVSAGFGPSIKTYNTVGKVETAARKDLRHKTRKEPKFEDLLEEVMSGIKRDFKTDSDSSSSMEAVEARKIQSNEKKRGVWKRVRVQPSESLEVAESQNIGSQLYNTFFTENLEKQFGRKMNFETRLSENSEEVTSQPEKEEKFTTISENIITTLLPEEQSLRATEIPTMKSDMQTEETTIPTNHAAEYLPDPTTQATIYEYEGTTDLIDRRMSDQSEDDLDTQPSLFAEVKKQLTHLFSIEEEPEEDIIQPTRRQEYTSIQRIRNAAENTPISDDQEKRVQESVGSISSKSEKSTKTTTEVSPFHKNLMGSVVYATSTSTEVSQDTEICYRGRCIKTIKSS